MINPLLLAVYFSMPVMIHAAPQLIPGNVGNVLEGLGLGALGGGSNGVLGTVSNPVGSLGGGALTGAATGTLTGGIGGGLLGRSQTENFENLAGSDHVPGHHCRG